MQVVVFKEKLAPQPMAAWASVRWDPAHSFTSLLVKAPEAAAYPIAASVFGVRKGRATGYRRRLARSFFEWTVTQGGGIAQRLAYPPLPPESTRLETTALR